MEDTNSAQGGAQTQDTEPKRRPWDKLPIESVNDFAMFEAYLRQPAPRSARSLARATGQLSARAFDRLRQKNEWLQRAAAYDEWRLAQAIETLPRDDSNPYKALLDQSAKRGRDLHDAAELILGQCKRVLDHAERQYMAGVRKSPETPPPIPNPHIVSAIRSVAEVMDKAAEAQAMCLGVSDVLKMQAEASKGDK